MIAYSSKYVSSFAIALFELLKEQGNLNQSLNDVLKIIDILKNDENEKKLNLFFNAYSINFNNKENLISKILKEANISNLNISQSLKLLITNKEFNLALDIFKQTLKLICDKLHIKLGTLYVIEKISNQKKEHLEEKISKKLNTKVILEQKIDPSLIGGFQIVVDDNVIEDSIKNKLESLRINLLKKVKEE